MVGNPFSDWPLDFLDVLTPKDLLNFFASVSHLQIAIFSFVIYCKFYSSEDITSSILNSDHKLLFPDSRLGYVEYNDF